MLHSLRHIHLFPKRMRVLMLASVAWFTAECALEFALPTYLQSAGLGYADIGALVSLVSVGALLVDLPAGALADKVNRGRMMAAGLVLAVLSSWLLFWAKDVLVLAPVLVAWGASYQLWKVPRDASLAALTTKKRRSEFYGIDTELTYLAAAAGPIIGGALLAWAGYSSLLWFYTVALLAAAALALHASHNKGGRELKPRLLLSPLKEAAHATPRIILLLLLAAGLAAFWEMVWTLQPLFYSAAGLSPVLGGMLMAAFSLPAVFLGMPLGRLADRHGKRRVLLAGMLLMGTGILAFSTAQGFELMVVGALAVSAGGAGCLPALEGLVMDWASGRKKGVVAGWMDFFIDAGFIAGPLAGGLAAQAWGLSEAFAAAGLMLIAVAAIGVIASLFAAKAKR
ncbi:MAG: MFS transporter [Candidatus Micrarchaeota archaeon]